MNLNFLSHPLGRIGFAVVFAVAVFLVGRAVFPEPQTICVTSSQPGYALYGAGTRLPDDKVVIGYIPTAFTTAGRHRVTLGSLSSDWQAEGTLTVRESTRPTLSFDGTVPDDMIRVDWCPAFAEGDTYVVEENDVITAYKNMADGTVKPTGFTLTSTTDFTAKVSPNGVYVAYIMWDAEKNATVLSVAEANGKNHAVLTQVTPEQGEMVLEELTWSGSKEIGYAEIVADEKTFYLFDVATHSRQGVHIDKIP